MRSVRPAAIPLVASVVLPALLVAGVLVALGSAPVTAGPSGEAAALDARIRSNPDVVLLGNSKVATDLDLAALTAAWSPDGGVVVPLGVNGTGVAVWYGVLQERVYAHGYTPKLVVVYATLTMMLQAELPSEGMRATLAAQMPEADPAVTEKIFGGERTDPRWQRVLNRRTALHTGLMDGLRDLAGRLAGPDEPAVALARVFANDRMATTDRVHAVPVAEGSLERSADAGLRVEQTLLTDLVESAQAHGAQVLVVRAPLGSAKRANDVVEPALERDVVDWLGAHGAGYLDLRRAGPTDADFGDGAHLTQLGRARLTPVLVRRLREEGYGDGQVVRPAVWKVERPRPAVERVGDGVPLPAFKAVRGRLACDWQGALPTLTALSDTNLREGGWGEVSPLRVLEDGVALKPHDPGPGVTDRCGGATVHYRGVLKYSPTDTPDGAGHTYAVGLEPTIPLISPTWDEAWWIYPGTSLRFRVPATSFGGPAGVNVRVEAPPQPAVAPSATPTEAPSDTPADAPADGIAPAPWMSIDGGLRIPLVAVAGGWEGRVPPGPHEADWTVEVGDPAAWLTVRRLALGNLEDPWLVIGEPPAPASVDVLAATPSFPREPRRLYGPFARPTEAPWKPGVWLYQVGFLGVPDLEEVAARAGVGCSPLRLALDGVPANTGEKDPRPLARATHSNDRMLVALTDGTSPLALPDSPTRFSFYLDPTRLCAKECRWVYPGDEVAFHVAVPALVRLRERATALEIAASSLRAVDGEWLHAEVLVGDSVVAEASVALADVDAHGVTVPLGDGVPKDADDLVVRVWVDSDRVSPERMQGYALLTHVALTEPPAPLFDTPPVDPP